MSLAVAVRGHGHGTFGSTPPRFRRSCIGGPVLLSLNFPNRLDISEALAFVVGWNFSYPTHRRSDLDGLLAYDCCVFRSSPHRRRGSGHRARKSRIARRNRGRSGDYPGGITVTEPRYLAVSRHPKRTLRN
jgi:hypothetical protein